MSAVEDLRAEWLAKVEVAEGLDRDAQSLAVPIAESVAYELPLPRPERVEEFRVASDRAKRAWTSAKDLRAKLDQALAAGVPA